jgi:hypothetical protein
LGAEHKPETSDVATTGHIAIEGALTGGNSLKVFLDGELVASGKLK